MKIERVDIVKFRNLSNLTVNFSHNINYIVGENNIGKSNFIKLLLFTCNPYELFIDDSYICKRAVDVSISIRLDKNEMVRIPEGIEPDEEGLFSVKIIRDFNTESIFVQNEKGEKISPDILKYLNFTRYDTLKSEFAADETPDSLNTRSFHSSLSLYVSELSKKDPEKAFLVLKFFAEYLLKKEAFRKLKIKTRSFDDGTLFSFTDKSMNPDGYASDGLQFIAESLFDILIRIYELYRNKGSDFEKYIINSADGKKYVQLILAIDEPEVHLHPYLQRALINHYKKIFANEDYEFSELLQKCFGVDGINGQIIIITHSTDALMDDHRNIIRFYRNNNGKPCAVSGIDLKLQWDVEKHLIMHFPEIKEAFYSKCTIVVEGESEYGCLGLFAERLKKPLDDFGICLVNARGEGTIPKLVKLFNYFKIPSVVVYDNDVKKKKRSSHKNEFFTKGVCFEMDIVETLVRNKRFDLLKAIILEVDSSAYKYKLDYYFIRKPLLKIGYDLKNYIPIRLSEVSTDNLDGFIAMHYAWMYKKKGVLLGRIIGNNLVRECIPGVYRNAIYRAVDIALS